MRAASYVGSRTFAVGDAAPVAPGAGEVQIEVAYTGICGTDLHILPRRHGRTGSPTPRVIGHEMSGRIAARRRRRHRLVDRRPGHRHAARSCGTCPPAWPATPTSATTSTSSASTPPARCRAAGPCRPRRWCALPDGLPLDHAALVEPTAVAVHDVRRAALRPARRCVVVGGGPVGLLIAVARHAGAEVVVVELDAVPPGGRRELGLRGRSTRGRDDVAARSSELDRGAGADVAFEVSGAAAGVATAVDVSAVRGRLVVVAIHPQPREIDLHRFFWRELTILGARVYQRADFETAVELVAAGAIPAERSSPGSCRSSERGARVRGARAGGGVMKILVDCRRGRSAVNEPCST